MASWISLVALSSYLVIAHSFPTPDEYNIPEVGNRQRSQYYVLHDDGSYKYGFDTGEGAFESVKLHSGGNLDGKFGYTDPEGNEIKVEYDSGTGGFVARGDHLPQPHPEILAALAATRSAGPFVDPLANGNIDPSYNFGFKSDESSRSETSDDDGTVTGSYSYVDENGDTKSYNYRAGKGIGFVIEGDDIPRDANSPVGSLSSSSTSFKTSTKYSSPSSGTRSQSSPTTTNNNRFSSQSRFSPASVQSSSSSVRGHSTGSSRRPSQSTPFRTNQVSSPSFNSGSLNSAISSQQSQSSGSGDSSYSFSYDAGDHSRVESADQDLNIEGSFSFIGGDGEERTLNYVAGSATGFQAQGSHLPVAPEGDFGDRISDNTRQSHSTNLKSSNNAPQSSHSRNQQSSSNSLNRQSHTRNQQHSSSSSSQQSHTRNQQPSSSSHTNSVRQQQVPSSSSSRYSASQSQPSNNQFPEANIRSSSSSDGSYSFSYDNPSHSRSESGNNANSVVGNFGFTSDDDGQHRQIRYEASSDTGFIAEGSHIPTGPIVPGAPSGQPTGRIVPVATSEFIDPLADTASDASYNFNFESDTYSRTEAADQDGNVSGTYTVVDDDGTTTTYQFRAGKGIGYETEIISKSQGPPPQKTQTSSFSGSQHNIQSQQSNTRSGAGSSTSISQSAPNFRIPSRSTHSSSGIQNTRNQIQSNSLVRSGSQSSSVNPSQNRNSFSQSNSFEDDFTLHQYSPEDNTGKYGYVLKFD